MRAFFYTEEDNKKMRVSDNDKSSKDYIQSLQFFVPGLRFALNSYYSAKEKYNLPKVARRVDEYITKELPGTNIARLHHHLAHAWASVPFMKDKYAKHLIFTLDGAGDNISGSVNILENGTITKVKDIPFDSSIGLLYNAIVNILGMKPNEHEFKVMGLAPYAKKTSGEEVYKKLKKLVWFDHAKMSLDSSIPTSRATSYFIANNYHKYRFDSPRIRGSKN
jgi:carbamoyltransferase